MKKAQIRNILQLVVIFLVGIVVGAMWSPKRYNLYSIPANPEIAYKYDAISGKYWLLKDGKEYRMGKEIKRQ